MIVEMFMTEIMIRGFTAGAMIEKDIIHRMIEKKLTGDTGNPLVGNTENLLII